MWISCRLKSRAAAKFRNEGLLQSALQRVTENFLLGDEVIAAMQKEKSEMKSTVGFKNISHVIFIECQKSHKRSWKLSSRLAKAFACSQLISQRNEIPDGEKSLKSRTLFIIYEVLEKVSAKLNLVAPKRSLKAI